MRQILVKSLLILLLLTTVNCGFKVINESEKNEFSIENIKTSGDKRINFKIKSNLFNSAKKNNQNILFINLVTKKKEGLNTNPRIKN